MSWIYGWKHGETGKGTQHEQLYYTFSGPLTLLPLPPKLEWSP